MKRPAIGFLVLMTALGAAAQQDKTATATEPALISNVVVRSNDSELVRAAKMAVKNRQARAGGIVIDDSYMGRLLGPRSAPSSPAALPPVITSSGANQVYTPQQQQQVDRAGVARRVDALKQEHARMREESEQPYGGDVSEDKVNQRLTQIPGEINAAQKMVPPPRPPN